MEPKLKVEYMDVGELIPYANNAKEHPDWQVEQIAASIRQFGMCDPVGVWTNPDGGLEIVEGHGRVLALKEMGVTRCPIIKLDHLDDEGRRAYTHIHNQTNITTGFDWEALDAEIASMPEIDWGAFGFDSFSNQLMDSMTVEDFNERAEDHREEFGETFIFPIASRDNVKRFLKEYGKQQIVEEIVQRAEAWE